MKRLKRWSIALLILVVLLGAGYLLRGSILKGMGNYLIKEDTEVKVEAAFVLSGMAYERSLKAREMYDKGYAPLLIPVGEGFNDNLRAVGIQLSDAALGRQALMRMGVDSTAIRILEAGTSTQEESEVILGYAKNMGFQRIMIISSRFHTRRVQKVFKRKFKDAGIDVFVVGAAPQDYDIDAWWHSEMGLIFVNNEYMKLLYYAWKY